MISKKLTGLAAIAGLFLAGTVSAQVTSSIANTEHDFSPQGFSGGEVCIVCHNTHNTDTTVTDAPLWNHAVTNAVFTPYSSATMNATAVGQPNGLSLLCLSCHDGTVAIDSFGGTTGSNFLTGGALVGTDLADDHPIGFTYDAALNAADPGVKDPTVGLSGITATGTIAQDMLFNGLMECGSCHDVHDATNEPFLRKDNAGSALCSTCHNQ